MIVAPIATAPKKRASGKCPITAVSTIPSRGTERFAKMIGAAILKLGGGVLMGLYWLKKGYYFAREMFLYLLNRVAKTGEKSSFAF